MPEDQSARECLDWAAELLRSESRWLRAQSRELVAEGQRLVRDGRALRWAFASLQRGGGVVGSGVASLAEA